MAEGIEPCDGEEDPDRCQAMTRSGGQCTNKGAVLLEGYAQYCRVHSGNVAQLKDAKQAARNYRLTKYRAQLQRHAGSSHIKSIREEIGILRMLIEEKLNQCSDVAELLIHSQVIADMVLKVEKLVTSCHKLEGAMGQTLDKQAILQFASEIIGIIGSNVQDERVSSKIADEIMQTVSRIGE